MKIEKVIRSDFPSEIFEIRVGEWLSSSEAAEYLRVSSNAIRIMVCRGKLRTYKLGARHRFHINDLRRLLQQGVVYGR